MKTEDVRKILKDYGLKVTPQRLAVYEALCELGHPYADDIVNYVRKSNPSISVATIYNTLEHFREKSLLFRLETCHDKTRYDCGMHQHYHICDPEKDMMVDYNDPELNELLHSYFENKNMSNVAIKDIRLTIVGDLSV
jgi:Fur family peroxide stress response transcriptional regulator